MTRITVLLADDHAIVRKGLRTLLDAEGDFEVVGAAANGREAVELTQKLRPAVVVMDIAMPQLNGLDAARLILQRVVPPPKVLILSAHSDDAYVEQAAAMGVAGYLVKQTSAHILARAIREILKGKTFCSPSVAQRLGDLHQDRPRRAGRGGTDAAHLTSCEREVLQRVAEGGANKQVAADLGVSMKTVERHRQSVMQKLNIHDTAGLTRYAISVGIIETSVQCTIA